MGIGSRCVDGYSRAVVKHPCVMILATIIVVILFLVGAVARGVEPDFDQASKGFEARGTPLAGRLLSMSRGLEMSQCAGDISSLRDSQTYHTFAEYPSGSKPFPTCPAPDGDTCYRRIFNNRCDANTDPEADERATCAPNSDYSDCNDIAWSPPSGRRKLHDGMGASSGGSVSATSPVEVPALTALAATPESRRLSEIPAAAYGCDCGSGCMCGVSQGDCPSFGSSCNWDGSCNCQVDPPSPPRHPSSCTSDLPSQACNVCFWDSNRLTPNPPGVQIVFERASSGSDLLSRESMIGMCELADEIYAQLGTDSCEHNHLTGNCCGARTLGTYVALLSGRANCRDITDSDVDDFKTRLRQCKGVELGYRQINTDAGQPSPPPCEEFNAVFDTFNALLDRDAGNAFKADSSPMADINPEYTKLMMYYYDEERLKDLHLDYLEGKMDQTYGNAAKLTAYDLSDGGVKFSIFSIILFGTDMPLICCGIFVILSITWLYSGSFLFSLLAFTQIFLAIALAYGLYMAVVLMPYFPFINMTGTFLCIGIGADDIFVLLQAFDDCIRHRPAHKRGIDAELIREVTLDAGAATFVTSLTTAGAFFASATSNISAIKCFGVFCGLVVMCDWIVMLCFLPPLAVLYERHFKEMCCTLQSRHCLNRPMAADDRHVESRSIGSIFVSCLGPVLTHRVFKWIWALGMLTMALLLGQGFMAEGFRLPYPSSSEMQMLSSASPFERYCCTGPKAKTRFTLGAPGSENGPRFVSFTFGLVPTDNGNMWDPLSHPKAELRSGVDLTSAAAQQWLHDFVVAAQAASWFAIPANQLANAPTDLDTSPQFPFNNTFEQMFFLTSLPCGSTDRASYGLSGSSTCCGLTRADFPFAPSAFADCLADMNVAISTFGVWDQNSNIEHAYTAKAGMTYDDLAHRSGAAVFFASGQPRVITLGFPTSTMYSEVYAQTDTWLTEMERWADAQFSTAPPELSGGFVSVPFQQLDYFSLQTAMAESSAMSSLIALIIACIVLFVVTRNILVAVYTTLTVVLIILSVSGVLMSMGWEQGIMESIIISCGIGMACDFAAHIGFAFRQANVRREAVTRAALAELAIRRMLPALSAAAFSTAVMSCFMTFAGTLFTIRFGIFILLLMGFGWLFATFFLLPLLAAAGPLGRCGEPLAMCIRDDPKLVSSPEGKANNMGVGVQREMMQA
mmetsp:Transcript_26478/g.67259  ORF Transcript_26478/g.67259 Transcript_26478/m.67259 type:complete len:1192 (+) Transcript_26478:58-3633(+)